MSATRTERRPRPAARRSAPSHLGGRLRRVLVSPRAGFAGALRSNVLERASDSRLLGFLAFLGGAGTMIVWLKVTALTQLADERPVEDTTVANIFLAVLVGALFGLAAYLSFGRTGPGIAKRLGGETSSGRLRLAWAFADFPLAAYVVVFLPLDLLVVGPEMFSTDRLDGSFEMVWAALSVALALSAAAWSTYLLWRGIEAATGLSGRALVGMLLSAFAIAMVLYVLLVIRELF